MLFYMRGARYKNSIALHDWPAPPACTGSVQPTQQTAGADHLTVRISQLVPSSFHAAKSGQR